MKTTRTQCLLLALLCATQISVNTVGMEVQQIDMENEIPKLLPEIQGQIVTTILNLYLNELDDTIDNFLKELNDFLVNRDYKHLPDDRKKGMRFWGLHDKFSYKKNDNKIFDKILYWIQCTRFKPLQENICLNTQTRRGNTILLHTTNAVSKEKKESDYTSNMLNFVQYLLKNNADPTIQNKYTKTAFSYCIDNNVKRNALSLTATNLMHLFLDHPAISNIIINDNILCILTNPHYREMTNWLLEHVNIKSFINNQNSAHDTLACIAAREMCMPFLEACIPFLHILIDNGADFTIQGSEGRTPLEWAIWKKNSRSWNDEGIKKVDDVIKFLQDITNNQTLKEQQ